MIYIIDTAYINFIIYINMYIYIYHYIIIYVYVLSIYLIIYSTKYNLLMFPIFSYIMFYSVVSSYIAIDVTILYIGWFTK